VPCPVARGLLNIGSAVVGKDLRKEGRTLEGLGLSGLSKEEMRKRLA
jgi:opine dehydrogenase